MTVIPVDVAVIGDGPAGTALAQACVRRGGSVALIGEDRPWTATYATWVDDLPPDLVGRPADVLDVISERVRVQASRTHLVDRAYGVIDNEALRRILRDGVDHIAGRVTAVSAIDPGKRHVVTTDDGQEFTARFVVDATGWPPGFAASIAAEPRAWQTAFGVVLPGPPTGALGVPTLMDFSAPVRSPWPRGREDHWTARVTTFCYSLPVHDGWLVEETVLAATTPIAPDDLAPRLAARLGWSPDELLRNASRTESVRIPMGVPLPARRGDVIAFGAAAGYIHPATGFSVAASLRAASRVAAALLAADANSASISDAVWPRAHRRTRILHDQGLDVLLRLNPDEVAAFFDAFFDLPPARWSAYLRIDTEPTQVAAAMTEVFRSASWPLRRRMMQGAPLALARLLRP